MPNFTTDDLLLYLYGELDTKQVVLIENALQTDWALQQKLQVLKESTDALDTTEFFHPRAQTIESIKQYPEINVQVP